MNCSSCLSSTPKFYDNIIQHAFCNVKCQTQFYIGGLYNLKIEKETRIPDNIEYIVGPNTFSHFNYDGVDFLFFGEHHIKESDTNTIEDGLDIIFDDKSKKLYFVGTDQTKISMHRYIYALSGTSVDSDRLIDVFIEKQLSKGQKKLLYKNTTNSNMLDKIRKTIAYENCELKNLQCDTPLTRFHYVDYRGDPISDFFQGLLEINDKIDDTKDAIFQFFRSIGDLWINKLKQMYFSDNLKGNFQNWIKKSHQILLENIKPYLTKERFETIQIDYTEIPELSYVYKQYLMLKSESVHMAELIFNFFRYNVPDRAIEAYNIDFPSNTKISKKVWIHADLWKMDFALLCRLFRTYGLPKSNIRLIYAGDYHTTLYGTFFYVALQIQEKSKHFPPTIPPDLCDLGNASHFLNGLISKEENYEPINLNLKDKTIIENQNWSYTDKLLAFYLAGILPKEEEDEWLTYITKSILKSNNLNSLNLLLSRPEFDPSINDNAIIIYAAKNGITELVERLLKDLRVDPNNGKYYEGERKKVKIMNKINYF